MRLYGGIYYNEDGLSTSIRGMHLQTALLNIYNDNITNFGKVGYQRKEPVISSFAEYIGTNALSEVNDPEVGRIRRTKNPLDFALAKEGYFQCLTPYGVKLTRDGRFKMDKDGYILTLDNNKVLSSSGQVLKLSVIPESVDDIKVSTDGSISVIDKTNNKVVYAGRFSVVSSNGSIAKEIDVRQGFTEDSNVRLHAEFFNLVPVRRNFQANRQLYIIQNDELARTIQELGKS